MHLSNGICTKFNIESSFLGPRHHNTGTAGTSDGQGIDDELEAVNSISSIPTSQQVLRVQELQEADVGAGRPLPQGELLQLLLQGPNSMKPPETFHGTF